MSGTETGNGSVSSFKGLHPSQVMKQKQKYLTVYDYGTGGVWQYFFAYNKKDII